jgi:ferritin
MLRTPIKASVLGELQRQLNQELGAAHNYQALSLWCKDQHFKGFASFFEKQAAEERLHAGKIIDHLLDRGVLPELGALPAPKGKFESILELAEHAKIMEETNTAGIHQAYEVALRETDLPSQVLLHWFISEQVEEEAWADELVTCVTRASCSGGLSDLDRHIERYLNRDES